MIGDGPRAAAADTLVLRLAPLPAETLEDLVSPGFRQALDAVQAAQADWETQRTVVLAAGDKTAIRLTSRQLRRALVAGTFRRVPVLVRQEPGPGADLTELAAAAQRLSNAFDLLEDGYGAEVDRILAALAGLAGEERTRWIFDEVRERLARFARCLGDMDEKPGRRVKAAMRLFRYLARVSQKTSPFQRYMGVGLCRDGSSGGPGPIRFDLQASESLAQEWAAVLRRNHAGMLAPAELELAGAFAPGTDRFHVELRSLSQARGSLWESVQPRSFRLRPPIDRVFRDLASRRFRVEELAETCARHGVAREQAAELAQSLIDKGLVRLCLPEVSEAAAALSGEPDPSLMARLEADPLLRGVPRLHRDCWVRFRREPHYDIAGIRDRVCRTIADLSMPSPEHRLLRDLFLAVKPPQAGSMPLSHFAGEIERAMPGLVARLSEPALARRLSTETLGPGSGHHAFCAHVQPFREDGALRLALNGTFNEPVWLLARYSHGGSGEAETLRRHLRAWLARQTELTGERFAGLSRGSDVNSLQRHRGLVDRYLEGFSPPGGNTPLLHTGECHVSLAPQGQRLIVRDGSGSLLRFLNLGSVLATPAWGLHYWLIHLTSPLTVARPDPGAGFVGDEEGRQRHRPREYHGDCVLFRETWYETSQDLLDAVWEGPGGAHLPSVDVMVRLGRYFRARGMPEQVFASRKPGMDWHASNSMANRHRKPQWIDVANPVCVALLRRILRESRTVVFQEVLPGPQDRLVSAGGGTHVVELHLEASLTW